MRLAWLWGWGFVCAIAVAGCGGDESGGDGDDGGAADAATDSGPTGPCESDTDCDDGAYCNGAETCVPDDEAADSRGCVIGEPPCDATEGCDEDADECTDDCPDADGDGHADAACGGDDCDDDDASAFPGNTEVCDADGHDEDCDPTTLGTDEDSDGYVSDQCCNQQDDGSMLCGDDCDDTASGINPGAADGCGGGDENCDGDLDDMPDSLYYRDADGDTYGIEDDTVMGCSLPDGYTVRAGDCIDDPFENPDANQFNPGEAEICDELDNDCDGSIDEGVTCGCSEIGTSEPCGIDPALDGVGICELGTHTCESGSGGATWSDCAGATGPREGGEICNMEDDDCDGSVDEGTTITCWADPDSDGFAALDAETSDECTCPSGFIAKDPATEGADCRPMDPNSYPGATEICDRIDNDCNRPDGVELAEDRDDDGYTAEGYGGCTGGFAKTDCYDYDEEVHPDQTGFFEIGYCTAGCQCGNVCQPRGPTGSCPLCSTSPSGDPASFDYNCDDVEEPVDKSTGCTCQSIGGCRGGGAYWTESSIDCGDPVSWRTCSSDACMPGKACASSLTSRVPHYLPCR